MACVCGPKPVGWMSACTWVGRALRGCVPLTSYVNETHEFATELPEQQDIGRLIGATAGPTAQTTGQQHGNQLAATEERPPTIREI